MWDVKLVDISGTKWGYIWQVKLLYLKQRGSLIVGGISSRSYGMYKGVSDDRQTAKRTLEPLVSELSASGDEVAIEK